MKKSIRRVLSFALCVCLLPLNPKAKADTLQNDARWIVVGAIAVGAALTLGIVYAFHRGHSASIRGCAETGAGGLDLRNEGDHQLYRLVGMTSEVKTGNRVRVTGKKPKTATSSGDPQFLVEKVSRDYGACPAPATK